jgi:hypothetical protein
MSITERIAALVERVRADEGELGKLSTGEALAAVLVLDRKDLLGDYTMLEAVERLGEEWFRAALTVQRSLAALECCFAVGVGELPDPNRGDASWPELQIPITQLAREGSPPPGLRLLQAKLSRNSNQIARGRIRQFESYMPSQAVGLHAPIIWSPTSYPASEFLQKAVKVDWP